MTHVGQRRRRLDTGLDDAQGGTGGVGLAKTHVKTHVKTHGFIYADVDTSLCDFDDTASWPTAPR